MLNNILFDPFIKIAKVLNDTYDAVPLLYGSLGLEILTGVRTHPEDVDVLIPLDVLEGRWDELKADMEALGYRLVNLREHEFGNERHQVSFSHIEDLIEFAGIDIEDIEERTYGAVRYRLLNLRQYQSVYSRSIQDGYRMDHRMKKDGEKIQLIQALLEQGDNDA